ncbi:MAG: hypothetical protein AAFW82_04215, partial [Pseudomonadota bacterium]
MIKSIQHLWGLYTTSIEDGTRTDQSRVANYLKANGWKQEQVRIGSARPTHRTKITTRDWQFCMAFVTNLPLSPT